MSAAVLLVAIASLSALARGADWPQWGGRDDRNMVSDEKGLPDFFVPGEKKPDGSGVDLATTKNVKWVARLGSQTYGNPTVAGGRVFIGTNDFAVADPNYQSTRGGLLKCLDEATGRLLWELPVPRYVTKDPNFNFDNMDLGICSSPTVDGDRVYLVSNRCEVLCVDLSGQIAWRYDMITRLPCWPQDAANCSVLVHGEFLYVCTSNGVDRSHDRVPYPLCPSLIVLDKRSGRLVAQDEERIGTRLFHGLWSSPSLGRVADKTLVFFGDGEGLCNAFEAISTASEGVRPLRKVWSFDCNPPRYKFENGKPIPYRRGDVRLNRGNKNDGTYIGPSEIIATPVFYRDRVYVATGQDTSHGRGRGMLSCIDATKTGDVTLSGKIWTFDQIDRSLSTVSIADGLLYVADFTGALFCLDADSGRLYWKYETKAECWGSTLVADGKVYLGTKKGFWIFRAGKSPVVLNMIRPGAPVYSTPIVANGVLYVPSHRNLWAVVAGRAG